MSLLISFTHPVLQRYGSWLSFGCWLLSLMCRSMKIHEEVGLTLTFCCPLQNTWNDSIAPKTPQPESTTPNSSTVLLNTSVGGWAGGLSWTRRRLWADSGIPREHHHLVRALHVLVLWRQQPHRGNQGELRKSPRTCHVAALGQLSSRQSRESSELSLQDGQGQWQKSKVSTTMRLPASRQGHRLNWKCNRRFPGEAVILWQFFPEEVNDNAIDGEETTEGNLPRCSEIGLTSISISVESVFGGSSFHSFFWACWEVMSKKVNNYLLGKKVRSNFLQLRTLIYTYMHTHT